MLLIWLSVYLSICVYVCLPVCLSAYLSVYLLPAHLPACLHVRVPVYPIVCLSTSVHACMKPILLVDYCSVCVPNAPVPLCRIYSRTRTNQPFKFIRGSFLVIPIHSNSVLLICLGSVGEYESFEHVQKLCVASANKFHSCLCALKTFCYSVCRTAYILYSSHSHYILTVFWLFLGHSYR